MLQISNNLGYDYDRARQREEQWRTSSEIFSPWLVYLLHFV